MLSIEKQKSYYQSGQTRAYLFRQTQLKKLYQAMNDFEKEMFEALKKDLNKSAYESYLTEIGIVKKSISHVLKHLKKWMKTTRVHTPIYQLFTSSYIQPEPLGTVLIIAAYNYPVQLLIEPLIGAIAAGNTAIVKPSEQASHTEKVLVKLINKTFDSNYIDVVTGDASITSQLLDLKFDHIFFTGSSRVGQIVYEKAAKQLIPVTLELGGKSPAIVTKHANIKYSAQRIAFGKWLNAGQTCIAPDYVYVDSTIKDHFLFELKKAMAAYHQPADATGSMITNKHYERILSLTKSSNLKKDDQKRVIQPCILDDVSWDDDVMKEEIFGPILPVLTFTQLDDVITLLKTKPKPLALYMFTDDQKEQHQLLQELSFGGGAINDTIMHIVNPHLPFGGIGQSGMGSYHGYASFQTFSHFKSYTKKGFKKDMSFTYPPASDKKLNIIKKFLK